MDGIQQSNSDKTNWESVFYQEVADAFLKSAKVALVSLLQTGHDEGIWGEIQTQLHQLPAAERVNITVRTNGRIRASMSGEGVCLVEQIRDAIYRCLNDRRFDQLVLRDAQTLQLELWIQKSSEVIEPQTRFRADVIDLGLHGVEVEWNDAFAYFKPSVALTSGFRSPQDLFGALCRKAGLFEEAWRQEICTMRRTQWLHICSSESVHSCRLSRLRPIVDGKPSKKQLIDLVSRCVSYLINNQYFDGSYCYLWNPLTGVNSHARPNSVRASGCAYSMALAASSKHLEHSEDARNSAKRSIERILKNTNPWKGGLLVTEGISNGGVWGKLGSTALLAASLTLPTFLNEFEEQREGLFRSIAAAQAHDGSFCCNPGSERADGRAVDYFPGEALIALLLKAQAGDQGTLELVDLAFEHYRNYFRTNPTTAFVGWHADAWSRAASLRGNSEYASFVFEQIDWLLNLQVMHCNQAELTGGFKTQTGALPNVSSVVYTEAVLRGMATAQSLGDKTRFNRYKLSALAGLRFCQQLIVSPEQAGFLEQPKRARGGVTGSLQNFEIRADHVQHTITLLLAALELAELLDIA